MAVHLTEKAIARAVRETAETRRRRDLADAACPGLRLRLTPPGPRVPAGSRTWVLACRDRLGRMRQFPLGSYPERGISEARDEARALHVRVKREGEDPIADRRRSRESGRDARLGIGTLGAVIEEYSQKAGKELESWPHSRKRIDLVFKRLLGQPHAELTAADLQAAANSYAAAQSAAFAVRTLRPVLRWAAQRGHVSAELARLHSPAKVKRRQRVLSRDELTAILPVLRAARGAHAAVHRLLLLTLTRLGEASSARWRDIDFKAGIWTIPETKNGQLHAIRLPRQALDLLRAMKAAEVKPRALIFATASGRALGNWDRATKAIQAKSGTAGWNRHDLRRTGATMLGDMGELPDIIEAALNHTHIRSPLAATYNRSRYRPQVAVALQRLADALDDIETGAGQVTALGA